MMNKTDSKRVDTVRCRSMKGDGTRCPNHTRDSSGLCAAHLNGQDFFSEGFLKCSNCTIQSCEYRGQGVKGYCYYEITDKVSDLDSKVKVIEGMRRTIAIEMRLVSRLEKALNAMKTSCEDYNPMLTTLAHINDQLNRHLQSYGRFLGWQSDTSTASQKEDRLKILKNIFKEENASKVADEAEHEGFDGEQETASNDEDKPPTVEVQDAKTNTG